MKPRDVIPMLLHTMSLPVGNRPVINLCSPPGTGKTAMAYYATMLFGATMVNPEISHRDTTDMGGYPIPDMANGLMKYLRPAIMPELSITGAITWFLDEIDKCAMSSQNALLGVVRNREIHGHKLSDATTIITASNPAGTRSGGQKLTTALESRIITVNVERP